MKQFVRRSIGHGLKKIDQIAKTNGTKTTGQTNNDGQNSHNGMLVGLYVTNIL
jgi:hypothetical protein